MSHTHTRHNRTDRRNPKVVTDMMYHSELNEDAISTSSTSSGAFDINEIMLRRERDRTGMSVTRYSRALLFYHE